MPINKRIIISLAIIGIVLGSSIGIIVYLTRNTNNLQVVEIGDTVTVKYTLWVCDDNFVKLAKIDEDTMENVEIKESAEEQGWIWGFWDAVVGMPKNVPDDVLLEKCIDDCEARPSGIIIHPNAVAMDGWDDRYDVGVKRAASYGWDHEVLDINNINKYNLRFTNLWFRIEILNITKG